jgi:hypothetical protein
MELNVENNSPSKNQKGGQVCLPLLKLILAGGGMQAVNE